MTLFVEKVTTIYPLGKYAMGGRREKEKGVREKERERERAEEKKREGEQKKKREREKGNFNLGKPLHIYSASLTNLGSNEWTYFSLNRVVLV